MFREVCEQGNIAPDLLDVEDDAIATDHARSDGAVDDGGRAHAQTMHYFLAGIRKQSGSTREMLSAHGVADEVFDRKLCNLVSNK
jgi:hypothetical protein